MCGALAYEGQRVVYGQGESNVVSSNSMRPASTLDRSRISLMSDRRWRPRTGCRRCTRLVSVELAEQSLAQDFRETDDGVERRAQLMRHVGEKFRLVAVGHLDLPALFLDLVEPRAF